MPDPFPGSRQERSAGEELAVAVLVEPGAFDIEQFETWCAAGKGKRVNGELSDRLIRSGRRLVVENVKRAVSNLQKIDMAGQVARFVHAFKAPLGLARR
jgi:hypothetical protein